jgi:outer membrane protein TolC
MSFANVHGPWMRSVVVGVGVGMAVLVPSGAAAQETGSTALTLDQAVQLTLSRNERARISDLNVVVANAAVQKAFTAFLPLVTLTGQDAQTSYPSTKTLPNNIGTSAVTVNQPLLIASSFPLYAQAKNLASAQRYQNVDDRRLLGYTAATAFFTVLDAQEVVQAAQRQFDNAKSNLSDTQARAQAQLSSSNDVTKAQADLASAQHELENDKGSLDNSFVQLAFTINAPMPSSLTPPAPTLTAAEKPAGGADTLVRFAVDHRPDVAVAKYDAVAARDFASEPLLRLVPVLALQGQAAATTNPSAPNWNEETLQGTLTWTIFDQGARYADKRSRDAQQEIADQTLLMLVRSVDAQVRSAVVLLVAAQAAYRAASDGVKYAQQNVDETAILYRQGLATALELVDANDSRFTAESNFASAQFAMAQAYLGLRQALGLDALGTELR